MEFPVPNVVTSAPKSTYEQFGNTAVVIVAFLFLYWVDLTHVGFTITIILTQVRMHSSHHFNELLNPPRQRTGYNKETLLIDTTILVKKSLGSGSYATFPEF